MSETTNDANREATEAVSLDQQLLQAAKDDNIEAVKDLLQQGANAAYDHDPPGVWGSQDRSSPLHHAIRKRNLCMIRALIEAKADVNAVCANYDWRGCGSSQTAFEMILPQAVGSRGDAPQPELLRLVLAAKGDPNIESRTSRHSMRTDGGSSTRPIHTVVQRRSLECAAILIEAKADVTLVESEWSQNERGFGQKLRRTALHLAASGGDPELIQLLLRHKADVDALAERTDNRDLGLDTPTDDPRDPRFVNSIRQVQVVETPLHMAIQHGHADAVRTLILHGADKARPMLSGTEAMQEEYGWKHLMEPRELCNGDEGLLQALDAEWSTEDQRLAPTQVRQNVHATMLAASAPGDAAAGSALASLTNNAHVMDMIFGCFADKAKCSERPP